MKARRLTLIFTLAVVLALYVRAFLPPHLDPDFLVYGQSAGNAPCTLCPFVSSVDTSGVVAGTTQNVGITGMNFALSNLFAFVSGDGVTATTNPDRSDTAATLTINATAGASLGARQITLSNGAGQSGSFCCLLIKSFQPGPVLDSITPTAATAGAAATDITLTGSGFDLSSVVRINGVDVATTFNNATQLLGQIPASLLSTTSLLGITVGNPGPSTSNFKVFMVRSTNVPVLLGVVPRGLAPGTTTSGFLTGNYLLGATSVIVDNSGVAISLESGGTITQTPISITVLPNAPLGARSAIVATPAGSSFAFTSHFVVAPPNSRWSLTQPLQTPHYYHTATTISGGRVLIAGGGTSFAEIYIPSSQTWSLTNAMSTLRNTHTATLLTDGKVLVAGGINFNQPQPPVASCDVYDPALNVFAPTGPMSQARYRHTATLLNNGKVLVVGGWAQSLPSVTIDSAELYDPSTGNWTPTGSLSIARGDHTATLLPNGRVLVAGGRTGSSTYTNQVELYDPATGIWTPATSMNGQRGFHTATLLLNGQVLVAGGSVSAGQLSTVEVYDPASGNWTYVQSLKVARSVHTATLMTDGNVLVVGGSSSAASAELYAPSTQVWNLVMPAHVSTSNHTATLLPNGQVLVAGGLVHGATTTRVSEVFDNSTKKVGGQLISD